MRPRAAGRLVVSLTALSLSVAIGACAGRADFERRSFADVERVLAGGDLSICSTSRHRDGFANQAVATRTYEVGFDCPAPTGRGDTVRLVVDRFADQEDRDGAARQFEPLLRPRGDGAVWTWGPFTLFANGARDDDVMDAITDALDDAGAK